MVGSGIMPGMVGSGIMLGMTMTSGGGGYAAKTTTTTNEVLPGATGVTTMYGGQAMSANYGGATYGSTMMTGGPLPSMGGYGSNMAPPMGSFVGSMGPRPISPQMMGPGMTRPVSPSIIGGTTPPFGVVSAPNIINSMQPGMGSGFAPPMPPPALAFRIASGLASGIAPPMSPPALASDIPGSFVGGQTNTVINSGRMPPMYPPIAPLLY
jgi:hypothetical protein